ncbi:hypothetical protein CCMSSC00406_0008027 [Pleurotus cornucopiae]|uniref:Uncharacterized protein n=1 Tax=Pleurotus cornucopiae TaxID=5321 RepID=A0ACB7IUW8_PLECO|nr:hypothetical protein CCMSSC00406_0008027 [Pleurotus cornucopiae]
MGRGRPQLYKTPEEKAAASREKSKRYYYKKKAALSSQRRSRYRVSRVNNRVLLGAKPDLAADEQWDPVDIPGWRRLVTATLEEFKVLTKGSVRNYLEGLYQKFILDTQSKILSDAVLKVQSLQIKIQRCEKELLQLAGVGKDYRAAESVGKTIHEALLYVEEVSCLSELDREGLYELYHARQLMYQSL